MSSFFEDGFDVAPLSFYDALTVSSKAFGKAGEQVVRLWAQYNADYFGGALQPVPILFVPTSPYGHWVGLCTGSLDRQTVHHILLMNRPWDKVRETILHEMVHQKLVESGLYSKHDGQPWCDEIMRISRDYFQTLFWAGATAVVKVKDGKRRKSVRIHRDGPDGAQSLSMQDIAHWPPFTPPDLR